MAESIITVKDIKKRFKIVERGESVKEAITSLFNPKYSEKDALIGVNLEIKKGEVLGLIGPNGAGKSTLIKIMTGILFPDSGEVNALKYTPWEDREEYVAHIGAVFGQKSQLWWDLPPLDTFDLLKAIYKIPERAFKTRRNYMIKLLKVEDVVRRPTRSLSLGERMKCEVIAALLHNPKIVFLDEATIGMDIIAKNIVREFIKKINKKYNITFIVTTHDMQDIEKLCKRVVIINKGDIVQDSDLEEIKEKYIKHKIIDVKFSEKIKKLKVPHCQILEETPFTIKLKVPVKKKSVNEVVLFFIKNYKVADITISNPDIEEIIEEIYEE